MYCWKELFQTSDHALCSTDAQILACRCCTGVKKLYWIPPYQLCLVMTWNSWLNLLRLSVSGDSGYRILSFLSHSCKPNFWHYYWMCISVTANLVTVMLSMLSDKLKDVVWSKYLSLIGQVVCGITVGPWTSIDTRRPCQSRWIWCNMDQIFHSLSRECSTVLYSYKKYHIVSV